MRPFLSSPGFSADVVRNDCFVPVMPQTGSSLRANRLATHVARLSKNSLLKLSSSSLRAFFLFLPLTTTTISRPNLEPRMARPRQRVCLQGGLKLDLNRFARKGFVRHGANIGVRGITWTRKIDYPAHMPRRGLRATVPLIACFWIKHQRAALSTRMTVVVDPINPRSVK